MIAPTPAPTTAPALPRTCSSWYDYYCWYDCYCWYAPLYLLSREADSGLEVALDLACRPAAAGLECEGSHAHVSCCVSWQRRVASS